MSLFARHLAIDLGTHTTRIYVRGKGVVVEEPSIIARDQDDDKLVAVGTAAHAMIGRQNENVTVSQPLVNGVIADFGSTEAMLRRFIKQAVGRFHLTSPDAMITVPSGATSTEQRAVIDVGKRAGLKDVYLIQTAVASALGAGLPIIEPRGHMIIHIGSSTSEVAVLSLGGVVAVRSVRQGSHTVNEAIVRNLKRTFGLTIGAATAEEVKRLIGSVARDYESTMGVSGRSNASGQPTTTELHTDDIRPYLETSLEKIVLTARTVLEKTPPDLVADIVERGLWLSGGGAYIHGLEEYLERKLHVPVTIAQDPMLTSVKGAFVALTHLSDYKRSLLGL